MRIVVFAALVATLSACGVLGDSDPEPVSASAAKSQTCAEVKAGVDSFNDGDYSGTVTHFKKAIEPATLFAKTTKASDADDLLNAVRYYAGLQPREYPEAARTSSDFAKYKAITLGLCVPVDDPESVTT